MCSSDWGKEVGWKRLCWDQFYINSALFNLWEFLEIKFPIVISSKAQAVGSPPPKKRENICVFVYLYGTCIFWSKHQITCSTFLAKAWAKYLDILGRPLQFGTLKGWMINAFIICSLNMYLYLFMCKHESDFGHG